MAAKYLSKYELDGDSRDDRKSFLGITAHDEQMISALRVRFAEFAPQLAEGFYRHLLSHPETARLLADPQLLARLKVAQMTYFEELVSGNYDEEYFEKRVRVGEIHNAVGLEPKWYLGAYNQYVQLAFPFFAEQLGAKIPAELLALLKVIFLDIDLALQTYFAAATERMRQQKEELQHAVDMYFQAELRSQQYAKLAGHEVRGALQSISAICETVAEDFGESLPSEARESLLAAHRRCLKTHQVVENILSQPDRAGEPSTVNARQLVREVGDRLDDYAGGKDVQFKGLDDDASVWADPIALREVFANLIANAIHYADKTPTQIAVEYLPTAEEHVFCVADNGPGIPPELQSQVFEPFFRRGNGEQGHKGRGLGLHFVRSIAARHGGRAWVESIVGQGSRFYFSLAKEPHTA
ncbi:MAG TPA: protoglobin domain-containing protein [Pirellulales bacterium]|jgi:signal transduction histidine kinase